MHQTLKWCHLDTICASFKARAQCYVLGALHSSQHKSGRPVVISCQEAWTAVGIPGGERISALIASNFQNSTLRPNLTSAVASSLAEQQLGVFSHHIIIREGYCHTHTDARIPERSLVAWQTTDEHRCSSSSCTSCRCGSQLLETSPTFSTARALRCCCGESCARCRRGGVRLGWPSWIVRPSGQSR